MTVKNVDDFYARLIASSAHQAIERGYTREQIAELDHVIRDNWRADRHTARVRGLDKLAASFRSEGQELLAGLVESFKEHGEPI